VYLLQFEWIVKQIGIDQRLKDRVDHAVDSKDGVDCGIGGSQLSNLLILRDRYVLFSPV
jgi:hypothetical protein